MHRDWLYWLENLTIVGHEDPPADDPYERDDKGEIVEEDGEKLLKEGWEYDEKGEVVKAEEDNSEDEDDELKKSQARADELEEALRKERRLRKQAERDAKRKRTSQDKQHKDDEDKEAEQRITAAEERTKKLARGLLNTRRDQAIMEEARKQGFIDPSDALTDDIRADIDYDQDDDDPSDIEIDEDSVVDAVKALARRKKHLVGSGTPNTPSASRLRKNRNAPDESTQEATLQSHYPSLRG